jgi:hypothetical protein
MSAKDAIAMLRGLRVPDKIEPRFARRRYS